MAKDWLKLSYYVQDGILSSQVRDLADRRPLIEKVTETMRQAGFSLARTQASFGTHDNDGIVIEAPIGYKPGVYVLFGGAGAGKSTILRQNFDFTFLSAFRNNQFVGFKGGEPEFSAKVNPIQLLAALSEGIRSGGENAQYSDKSDDSFVFTVDSLARFVDYDVTNFKGKPQDADKPVTGGTDVKKVYDPMSNALMTVENSFRPAGNTKTTGVSGYFMHFITTLDAMCDKYGRYVFAIINAGLSDTPEFRSTVKGLVSGTIELDSPDSSLVRVVPLMTDDVKKKFDEALKLRKPCVPFTRVPVLNQVRIDAGSVGSNPFGDIAIPGVVGGN